MRRAIVIALGLVCAACSGSTAAPVSSVPSVSSVSSSVAVTASTVAEQPIGPSGDSFYQPPASVPDKPGSLIWWSASNPGPLGSSVRAILYTSTSATGSPVAVSGVIWIPAAVVETSPIMSYAHGTVGLDDRCAPSKTLARAEAGLAAAALLAKGFIVVATDYEGLGTPGVHPYVVGRSEGHGVLDAIRVARAVTRTTGPSLVWGHSQGGGAALWAAQLAPVYAPDARVIASVAGAPAVELRALGAALRTSPYFGYVFMTSAGLKAAYPEIDLRTVLTPAGVAATEQAGRDCGETVRTTAGKNPADYFLADPATTEPMATLLEDNSPGNIATDVPIFLYHGDNDEQIPVNASLDFFKRACRTGGTTILRTTYPGQTHAGVIFAAAGDILTYVEDRLAGKPAPSTPCAPA